MILLGGAITALLSGLLIPYITRSWQNHDRELERRSAVLHEELGVKSQLVNQIGRATANFLGASQLSPYTETAPAAALNDYDRAYVRWSTESAEIASQLAAYFPQSKAQGAWNSFSQNIRNTYLLVRNHPGDERGHWLDLVSAYLRVDSRTIKGIILHSPLEKRRTGSRRNQTYEAALRRLLLAVQQKERSVLQPIVGLPSSLRTS